MADSQSSPPRRKLGVLSLILAVLPLLLLVIFYFEFYFGVGMPYFMLFGIWTLAFVAPILAFVLGIIALRKTKILGVLSIIVSVFILGIYGFFYVTDYLATRAQRHKPETVIVIDPYSDLEFIVQDTNRQGSKTEISIKNRGKNIYPIGTASPTSCPTSLKFLDSDGKVIIGYYTDVVFLKSHYENGKLIDDSKFDLMPGETKKLCTWPMNECTYRGDFGCGQTEPLGLGQYRVQGTFVTKDGKETNIEKTIQIIP